MKRFVHLLVVMVALAGVPAAAQQGPTSSQRFNAWRLDCFAPKEKPTEGVGALEAQQARKSQPAGGQGAYPKKRPPGDAVASSAAAADEVEHDWPPSGANVLFRRTPPTPAWRNPFSMESTVHD